MLGHVNNVLELMHQVDLLVHTSITPEPFGQVIVEGMAVGLPVIASNEGGPVEIVVHNKTGLLITPRNPEMLRHSIQWMLDHPEERKLMSENAIKRVESDFTIDRTIKKITTYYKGLIIKA
jgi:glycosyltransferase involved in cell wall biosynthesis